MADPEKNTKISKTEIVLAGVMTAVVLLSVIFFSLGPRLAGHSFFKNFHPHRFIFGKDFGEDAVRGWMTFAYINKTFGLPSEFLKTSLNINSNKYPNLTVSAWTKQTAQNEREVLAEIQTLIRNYPGTESVPGK